MLADESGLRVVKDISRYDSPAWNALVRIGRPAVPAMIENIEASDNSEQLAGVALGIFAPLLARQLPPRSEREAMLRLLERLGKKQLEFGRRTESDKYIISILEKMRIRQEQPVPTTKKEKATRKR